MYSNCSINFEKARLDGDYTRKHPATSLRTELLATVIISSQKLVVG